MAQLVCSTPTLALLDMRFVQTYEALYQQVGALGDPTLREQDIQFDTAVRNKCGIALSQASNPSATPPPPAPAGSDQCVGPAYQQQISSWKSMLLGPAAEEANRSIQDQVALQTRLQALGFLPPQAQIDGVFGAGTRAAIIKWQASTGRQQTGLLGNADADALLANKSLEYPENATSAPNDGKQPSDTASSTSNYQQDSSLLTFLNPLGITYANRGETTWTTNVKYDEMTDDNEISVASIQTNDSGAGAQVTGTCSNKVVTFSAVVGDQSGKGIALSNESLFDSLMAPVGAVGLVQGIIKVNSNPETQNWFVLFEYNNQPRIAQLSIGGGLGDGLFGGRKLDLSTTWRILAEFYTDHGPLIIKIPIYDPQIEGFVKNCVGQGTLENPMSDMGYLGVAGQVITAIAATNLSLSTSDPSSDGALLAEVMPFGPAFRAGLQPGDVIIRVNNTPISNPTDLAKEIASILPGKVAAITYIRNGKSQNISVTLAARPEDVSGKAPYGG